MKKRQSLYFKAPYEVTVHEEPIPSPGVGEVLVRTEYSAVSGGTEMLFFRGQIPPDLAVDATIDALNQKFSYPLKYGYAAVGKICKLGEGVEQSWMGRRIFAFNPHESHFVTTVSNLHPVPQEVSTTSAALLPFMETAVSFLMDAQPMIGERVVLFGQGIVGLLTTALLASYPLAKLITLDRYSLRRQLASQFGAMVSLDPESDGVAGELDALLSGEGGYAGADLIFELSGSTKALDQAVEIAGYDGRILIGSWYGSKRADLNLGGKFHRSNMRLISSQVSHIAPRWRGRFDHGRRMGTAWSMLAKLDTDKLITHRFPITQAHQAYKILDQNPNLALQVILTYE